MDKYEYRLKTEQIEKLIKKKDYEAAAEIADTIDWRRVKNIDLLYQVAGIYEQQKRYEDCMEILNIAYDRAPVGRMLLYKMTEISAKLHHFDEAISLYREFVKSAPHDQSRYVLKYQIYRERGSSLEDQIKILSEYKVHEYQEQWAYELAHLYAEAGQKEECVRECDELILWFSEGEYVFKALELKKCFEPLSAAQEEKYKELSRRLSGKDMAAVRFEKSGVPVYGANQFDTMNLQKELAANLDELLKEDKTVELPELDLDQLKMPELDLEEPVGLGIEVPELEIPEPDVPGIEVPDLDMLEPDVPEIDVPEIEIPDLEISEADTPKEDTSAIEIPGLDDLMSLIPAEGPAEAEPEPAPKSEEAQSEMNPVAAEPVKPQPEAEPVEPQPEQKPAEAEPEPMVEKQITGQLTIDDVLADWGNKMAETEAALKAGEEREKARRDRVKMETSELVRLISSPPEGIDEEVQNIIQEIDETEKGPKAEEAPEEAEDVVTVDDLPQDLDSPETDEEEQIEITFEDLDVAEEEQPTVRKKVVSSDTASMSTIHELERSLAAEVSEMAVNSGHLTQEQARLFAYFTSVRGMSQQLAAILKEDREEQRTTSSKGNLVITGKRGNGKTTLAIDIVKALQQKKQITGKALAKISAEKLNTKDIYNVFGKVKGGALIIESAGGMSDECMMGLSLAMESDTGGLLIILEDSAEEIERLFQRNKNFASKFEHTIDIPVFSNDELVAFGKSYAQEQDYVFDNFAVLALYDKIGSRQTLEHLVSVAEVKDLVDHAIVHAEKGSVRHVLDRITGKNVDEFGNHLLREEDFEA